MKSAGLDEQTVGEAGCTVEAQGSLGSLSLVIVGKWGPECTFGMSAC